MPISMLFDNVLIKEIKQDSEIIVVGNGKRTTPTLGVVVAVGLGQSYGLPAFESTLVKEGDTVRFLKDVAHEVKENGEELWVVRERDILYIKQ